MVINNGIIHTLLRSKNYENMNESDHNSLPIGTLFHQTLISIITA
jgi:hypothetical protein